MEKVRQGSKEEARQTRRRSTRKGEDAKQGGGRKRESAPRTKLKIIGGILSGLKTILY